ncbi:MAG: ATP-binding protein [Marmoricola sp.]
MAASSAFLTPFIGRQLEIDAVVRAVESHHLVTLSGTGGLGKTRLAHQVLARMEDRFPGRVWVAELADLKDAALVGHLVSVAVDAPPPGEVFEPSALVAAIGSEPGLLLIDNCEHLVPACAALVTPLLRGCPGLRILTTTREALGVIGEHLYAVPSLVPADAVSLFDARAGAASPAWVLSAQVDQNVGELCNALEGVPLAIELVAAQVRSFSTQVLVDRLHDRIARLGAARGAPDRMSSLDASIQWSHDLCTEQERLLWHRLSVFAGGFSLDAAEQACADDRLSTAQVFAALAGLVEKSVVSRAGDADRYRMLELIRQFGLNRLASSGEQAVWQRRQRDHYLGIARQFEAEWWGPDQLGWMARLHQERRNLVVALDFSSGSPEESGSVLQMCALLEHFFASTGGGGAAIHWLQMALEHGSGTDLERANALRIGSFIANLLGEIETSVVFHDGLLRLVQETGDERIRAHALYAESQLRTYQNDVTAGIAAADAGVDLLHALGESGLEANLHFLRGMILGWADRADEAAAAYRRCLEILEPRGERWLVSYSQWGLGVDALTSGDLEGSIALERAALRTKADFGDQLGIGLTLEALAWAAAEQRRASEAALLLGAAEAIWDRIGMSVAAMPYLSRRRHNATETIRRQLAPREYADQVEDGRVLEQSTAVAVALGEARVPGRTTGQSLTRREREVAELVTAGQSNRAIADHLFISVRTVESHVDNLLRKLGVSTRADVGPALGAAD